MKAVNLLPRETRNSRGGGRMDPLLAGGAAVTVVVAAAIGGGFFLVHSHAASAQKKLATARAGLAVLEAAKRQASSGTTPVLPTPTVTQSQAPWQSALASALQGRVPWDAVLSQLARVVPPNVTVSTVTLGSATSGTSSSSSPAGTPATPPPAAGIPGALQIGGTAFSEAGVAELLSRVALVPNLSDVTLTSSSADPKNGQVTFEISAQVSIPAIAVIAVTAATAGGTSS